MYSYQRKPARLFTQLIIAVGVAWQGGALAQKGPAGAGQIVPKESKMQPSPSDPKQPQKSRPPIPEMVGATSAPFELGKGVTTISFEVHAPTGPALLRGDGQPKRVLLNIENLRSNTLAPSFGVYLNLPPGEEHEKRRDLLAFTMSTFGLVEASVAKGHHPGDGLNAVRDVTELYVRLRAARDWDDKALRVAFVPKAWKGPIKVQVGRVSLMIE